MTQNEILSKLVAEIVYIRDKDFNCIICGNPIMGIANACHYIKASKSTLFKWDLRNVNLGHQICNFKEEFTPGLQELHTQNMLEKYGVNVVMELHRDKNKTVKFSKSDKDEMIKELKSILKELKQNA